MLTFRTVIAALTFATLSAGALAQDVTVMISGGFKAALEKLRRSTKRKAATGSLWSPARRWAKQRRPFRPGSPGAKKRTW